MSTGPGSSMESSDKSTSQLSPVTQHAPSVPSPLPPHLHFSQGPEQMQHWLHAKAEEERRLQEEEKTRQETLKLEQRKVEQAILTDALRAGVPPYLVPTIFAGLNGDGRFCQASAAAHQCMAQMHQIAPGPAEIQKAFSTAGEASHVDVSPEKDCASTTQSLPPSRGSESHPSAHPDQTQPRAAMNESQPGVLSKASSYIRLEARSSSSRKRKSTSAHYRAPPPPAPEPGETRRSTRSGRSNTAPPTSSPLKAGRPRRQRYRGNAADSDDSRVTQQETSDHEQGQTPRRTAAESVGTTEGITPERDSVESPRLKLKIKSACFTSDQSAQDQLAQNHVVSD